VTERGGRSAAGGGGRRAADAAALTLTDDDADDNETMSIVSNCSDMQTAAQLTDGKHSQSNGSACLMFICCWYNLGNPPNGGLKV